MSDTATLPTADRVNTAEGVRDRGERGGERPAARERTVAIVSGKGGSGKSTTALHLGGELLELGLRVLVVDLDPQASISRVLCGTSDPGGPDGSVGACLLKRDLQARRLVLRTDCGLDLLPGDRTIEIAADRLSRSSAGYTRLRQVLAPLDEYDALLIDTPPGLGFPMESALQAAAWALMPTQCTQQDLDTLVDTLAQLDDLDAAGVPCARRLAILPNAIHRDSVDSTGIELLRDGFDDLVAEPVPYAVAVKRAWNERRPLSQSDRKSPASRAYRLLARRVANTLQEGWSADGGT